jgi:4-hydroxybenzoate polyprenyltransferase
MAASVDYELPAGDPGSEPPPDLPLAPDPGAAATATTAPMTAASVTILPVAVSPVDDSPTIDSPAPLFPAARAAPHWLQQRLLDFALLMRLDRPIGIWLLLWPTLWALWSASGGHPQPRLLAIFLAGTVLMRSAGCVINDLYDRNIDPHVRRTRSRPLAARRVTPAEALVLFAVLIGLALLLVLRLNALCLKLAVIGAGLTATYPLLKRFFAIPQLYLGLCFAWGVPMAYAAQLGTVPRVGWVLMLAAVVWAGVYDTFYAMADRPDDLRIGIKSSAITFGDLDLMMVGAMQLMVLFALLFAGRLLALGPPYYWALAAGTALFAWQQWLARARDAEGCMRAFHNNNYFGIVMLAGVILEYSSRR